MCARVPVLTFDELRDVVASIMVDAPLVQLPDWPLKVWPKERPQAFPGAQAHVIVAQAQALETGSRNLATPMMTWGVEAPWKPGQLVFNTRLESAMRDAARGNGMWGKSFADGRCIVATAGFFEPHATERVISARSGKPIKRSYLFGSPIGAPLLLGGLILGDRFTVVTTEPNACVAPVHSRMPLVLSTAEAQQWLWGPVEAASDLADRAQIELAVQPEYPEAQPFDEDDARGSGLLSDGQMSLF